MALSSAAGEGRKAEPKSTHVADAALQPFIQATFDPADYLNSTLPALAISGTTRDSQTDRVPLVDLSSRTQAVLSQLNAQTSRLSNTLTQLTDEILRSGSRLAYEVETMRGETAGLSELLHDNLQEDIAKFVPSHAPMSTLQQAVESSVGEQGTAIVASNGIHDEPEFIQKLRTLTLVRSRLDMVIKTFGQAMEWPLPPSELAITSSFISVSAPEAAPDESRSREEKGRQTAQMLRNDIAALLEGSATPEDGIFAATQRIDELKELSTVWKGTAEEKARIRFIETLTKFVDDEQRRLARRADARRQGGSPVRAVDYRYGPPAEAARAEGGYGFMKNLQRIKGDIYLD